MSKQINIEISIIVPTLNSESTIRDCLHSIKSSNYSSYELLVVDDQSSDNTIKIAKKYTNKILHTPSIRDKTQARLMGFTQASGNILVNIDSDVLINKGTLKKISNYFKTHSEIKAITGLLSINSPYTNFSSQYKNLYMNYYFLKLPKKITFLYGSLFAIRKEIFDKLFFCYGDNFGEDTDMGQQLFEQGYTIHLLKDLTVTHVKLYSLISLVKNDFMIPYFWAQIYWKRNGWMQLGKNQTGYAHASINQVISLLLMPLIWTMAIYSIIITTPIPIILLIMTWCFINIDFFKFMYQKTNTIFTLQSVTFTFIDHNVMFLGVLGGTLHYFFSILKNAKPD